MVEFTDVLEEQTKSVLVSPVGEEVASKVFSESSTPSSPKSKSTSVNSFSGMSSRFSAKSSQTSVPNTPVFSSSLTSQQKATLYFLLGYLYNVSPEYGKTALDNLSKAAKLWPSCVDAWNLLGEVFWKKGDFQGAKSCFDAGLAQRRNKVSLRQLSMVMRQIGQNTEQRLQNIQQSVELCKEAVKMDVKDGISWLILGTSYLKLFFSVTQDQKDLMRALNAYGLAESCDMINNPDLYYNRAVTHQYLQNYAASIADYLRASYLDPITLNSAECLHNLLSYIAKTQSLIQKKANLKPKKLRFQLDSFKDSPDPLKHFGEGKREVAGIGELVEADIKCESGKNGGSVLNGNANGSVVLGVKVLAEVHNVIEVPKSYIVMDKEGAVFNLTIYNIRNDLIRMFNDIAIVNPVLVNNRIAIGETIISYPTVRVDSPLTISINGRAPTTDFVAWNTLAVETKTDF
ncbi:hypothetical protein BKA69DRAFT_1178831 [Paraphysoderma sedebokerense]|nr:hypothetical protein BKA69DRAFT_1178831 [Paraphysoderma sedebokerense]